MQHINVKSQNNTLMSINSKFIYVNKNGDKSGQGLKVDNKKVRKLNLLQFCHCFLQGCKLNFCWNWDCYKLLIRKLLVIFLTKKVQKVHFLDIIRNKILWTRCLDLQPYRKQGHSYVTQTISFVVGLVNWINGQF